MEIGRMANMEAEANILGAILVDNNKILTAADILESEDFYNAKNKSIYSTMLMLYKAGKKIDVTTLSEALGKKLKDVTILYISELIEKVSMGSIKDYCNIVKEKSKLRSLDRVAKNILTQIKNSDKDTHEIIGDLEKYLANIELRENPKLVSD
ncbi:DnaB-like helicase N-terminal domain-containing protein, partial [Clostridium sp. WILCCON 0269]